MLRYRPNFIHGLRRLRIFSIAATLLLFPTIAFAAPPAGDQYLAARRQQLAGDHAAAIPDLQAVMAADGPLRPFAAQALVEAATAAQDDTLLRAALATWARTERVHDVRVRAHRALGDHLMAMGAPADAAVAYAFWARNAKDSRDRSRAMWAQANAYRAAGRPADAEPLLWRIVNDDPSSVQARDALPLLPDTKDIRRRYEIGRVHLKHRNWKEADAWLAPLIDQPMSIAFQAQVLYAWAEAQSQLVSYAEGRRAMYQLALAYPRSGYARLAWQSIASYWSRDKQYAEAIRAYEDVADRYPDHDVAVQALWDAAKLEIRSDPPAAAARLATLQATYPRHILADDALRLRGLALYKHGAYAEAMDAFREGHTEYSTRRQADDCSYWEGKCALALGHTEAGRAAFERTVREWPNDYYAYRAAEQLRQLPARAALQPVERSGAQIVPASYAAPAPASSAEPMFTAEEMQLPGGAGEWLALFHWLYEQDLPEARDVIPQLRKFASTPAQKFYVAQLAEGAGDYEACIWLADGIRKARPEAARTKALADLLYPHAWFEHIAPHASAYDVDPFLPLAVMREESHFRDGVDSWAGARGVMQIMPSTGKWLGQKVPEAGPYSHDRLYEVPYNIHLGTYYLGYLMEKFGNNMILAVASYNGGEGNVRRWVDQYGLDDIDLFVESIPYDETNEYVKKVLGSYATYRRLADAARDGIGE